MKGQEFGSTDSFFAIIIYMETLKNSTSEHFICYDSWIKTQRHQNVFA